MTTTRLAGSAARGGASSLDGAAPRWVITGSRGCVLLQLQIYSLLETIQFIDLAQHDGRLVQDDESYPPRIQMSESLALRSLAQAFCHPYRLAHDIKM